MRVIKTGEGRAVLVLSRKDALQIVHDLVNQLADAPGAGSSEYVVDAVLPAKDGVDRGELLVLGGTTPGTPETLRRLAFMLDLRKP